MSIIQVVCIDGKRINGGYYQQNGRAARGTRCFAAEDAIACQYNRAKIAGWNRSTVTASSNSRFHQSLLYGQVEAYQI
jgi:hypothetical protein